MELILFTVLCIVIVGLFLYIRRLRSSTNDIARLLKEYRAGNLSARLFLKGEGPLNEIARDVAAILEKVNSRVEVAQHQAQKMEAILRSISEGMLIMDKQGTITLANRAFRQLFPLPGNPEGKNIIEVIRDLRLRDLLRRVIESDEILSEEMTIMSGNRDLHFHITVVPIYSDDPEEFVSGVVVTFHDITRLKQLEQVRKDFVANVSHEIKTPITAIKGGVETLLDGALDDRENTVRFLRMIENHSSRLNNLVDDLLTLSRIELGDMRLEKTDVNMSEVIESVYATLREKAERKGLSLTAQVPATSPPFRADRDRLIQILLNLVDNGIKFTEKGGVTVGVEERNGHAVLYVQDTGGGIPKQSLERIGERFYRVDRARSRDLGGTGLGLAIVKHLVKAHGWDFRIDSTLGKGTRIEVVVTTGAGRN